MNLNNHFGRHLRTALPLLLAATCSTDDELFPLDHRVKASYLLNLLRFIDWPHDVSPPHGRLNLCICGAYSLDGYYALHGERVRGRTLAVARIKDITPARIEKCHILVVSGDMPLVSVPVARGLMTVGESEGFTARGGLINLFLIAGRMRFELNHELAQACGFTIDPKLLRLRTAVWCAAQS
ncbi:MAG TPA: YfiR family protein [Burkholderiales bacterium]